MRKRFNPSFFSESLKKFDSPSIYSKQYKDKNTEKHTDLISNHIFLPIFFLLTQ